MKNIPENIKYFKSWLESESVCFIWFHGWLSMSDVFLGLVKNLLSFGDHFLYDVPGVSSKYQSKEDVKNSGLNIEEISKSVYNQLEKIGIFKKYKAIYLVGHSYGGKLCVQLSHKSIKGKIIIASPIFHNKFVSNFTYRKLEVINFFVSIGKKLENVFGIKIPLFLKNILRSGDYKITNDISKSIMSKSISEDLRPILYKQKNTNMLYLYGDIDKSVFVEVGRQSSSISKNYKFIEIKECDHYGFFNNHKDKVLKYIINFFKNGNK